MRRARFEKYRVPTALASACVFAFLGSSAARGDFIVTVDTPTAYTSDGINYSVYVFSAENTGTNGTGSELLGANVIINTPGAFNSTAGALGIDVEKVSGSGSKTIYAANVDGTVSSDNTYDDGGPAFFGDGAGGTFIGIGSGPYSTDLVNNGQTTEGGTQAIYINSQTTDYTPFNDTMAVVRGTQANIDPQFTTPGFLPGTSSSLGTLNNGTIHSLQIEELANAGAGATIANFAGGVPFVQVAVPTGTQFTIHGQLLGEIGNAESFTFPTIGPNPPPPSLLTIALSGAALLNSNPILPPANVSAGPQTRAVTGAAQTNGYLMVSGFTPASAPEIYGLNAVGATSLNQLISDLNSALQMQNPGATAEVPTGAAGATLTADGDDVELIFPTGGAGSSQPDYLQYNFANYTANGSSVFVTSITVLPEPGAISLYLAVACILGRRRRRTSQRGNQCLPHANPPSA